MNAYFLFQVNNLLSILLSMFLLVLTVLTEEALFQVWMMMMIHLFPINPRTNSTAAGAAEATLVPSTSAAGVSSKSGKKKANTLAREQDIVQLLLQHFRRNHRRLLVMTFVSLSARLLGQPTTSQLGELFCISTCLWFMTAYGLCT